MVEIAEESKSQSYDAFSMFGASLIPPKNRLHLSCWRAILASMIETVTTSPDPGKLRPLLHAEVDRLSDEHLSLAHRALLEIELHQLTGELDNAADAALNADKLTIASIAAAVAEHRTLHPYQ